MKTIEFCRALRGLSRQEVAERMGVKVNAYSMYERGERSGVIAMAKIAKALDVSEAYLRGVANRLAVKNPATGDEIALPIVAETIIAGYGAFYLLEISPDSPGDVLAVILHFGQQFTPALWQKQPLTPDEIPSVRWIDARGKEAEMADGLPST